MSLYNMMNQVDQNAGTVLAMLEIDPSSIARFRDAYPNPEDNTLVILTRTGGDNREHCGESNDMLAEHPLYIEDKDDDYDCTYALFSFMLPEGVDLDGVPKATSLQEKTEGYLEILKKSIDEDGGE